VGDTLAGSVGGWKDPTTEYTRRWVRCDPDGTACTSIYQDKTTDPETDSTYTVREDDIGYTIRMRVTADVNGDISDNGVDDHLPHATEVDTAPSAVVTRRPVGVGPGGVSDTDPPVVTGLHATNSKFRAAKRAKAKKGTTFKFKVSEDVSGKFTFTRRAPGRKAGKKCVKPTRKNHKHKRCTRSLTAGTYGRGGLKAGNVSVPFSGKVGKRKLKPGAYRATLVVTDPAGNKSKPATVKIKIVRR
jgi:hypothetical protein